MIDLIVHPHHRFTRSFEPILSALGQPVRVLYGDQDTLRDYLPSLRQKPPELLILWQLEHLAWWASSFCPVVIFPMYDHTMHTPDEWLLKMGDVRWICFSRTMHQRLAGLGLDSRYFPYAPNPTDYPEVSWEQGARGYFWERRPEELDGKAAKEILLSLGVDSLTVRPLADLVFAKPTESGIMAAERAWETREEYLRILAMHNVFVAPRRFEGIGMAFLEAMAMGMCVVAENQPTSNEYILSGHNGILFNEKAGRLFPPRKMPPSELIRIGREARESMGKIHQQWKQKCTGMSNYIKDFANFSLAKGKTEAWLEAVLIFASYPSKLNSLIESLPKEKTIWGSVFLKKKPEEENSTKKRPNIRNFLRHPRKTLISLLEKNSKPKQVSKINLKISHPQGYEQSIYSTKINLGPLRFIPHDGGFGSNFNFLVGEIYAGRRVYPVFTKEEFDKYNHTNKHYVYFGKKNQNVWFELFKPIQYDETDNLHQDSAELCKMPASFRAPCAPPEFRIPSIFKNLYKREDFFHWRLAVHNSVEHRIKLTPSLQFEISQKFRQRCGPTIGVHMRHPSHMVEQGHIFFQNYFSKIDPLVKKYGNCSIFLATDNDLSLAIFKAKYGDQLWTYDVDRTSIDNVLAWAYALAEKEQDEFGFVDGIGFQKHYEMAAEKKFANGEGIRAAREAVRDIYTLAHCDEFVCTISNFTLMCSYLNPKQNLHFVFP
jgi:hypothetical protein